MKEQLQRFYYKQIYANRKSIKNLIEAVTVTAFTWLVLSSISFHMIMIMGPLKLETTQEQEQRIAELEQRIADLKRYVNLDKFHCDGELQGYVNVKDILLRLRD